MFVDEKSRTIYLYGEVGEFGGITGETVINAANQLGPGPINLRINSPGGDVVEALAIYNFVRRHGDVTAYNDAWAASAAGYIFTAAKRRIVAQNSMLMIHDPWGISIGDAEEHRKTAAVYDKFAESLAADYAAAAGVDAEEMRARMKEEIWLNAEEAVSQGFAHEIGDGVEVEDVAEQVVLAATDGYKLVKDPPPAAKKRLEAIKRKVAGKPRVENVRKALTRARRRA